MTPHQLPTAVWSRLRRTRKTKSSLKHPSPPSSHHDWSRTSFSGMKMAARGDNQRHKKVFEEMTVGANEQQRRRRPRRRPPQAPSVFVAGAFARSVSKSDGYLTAEVPAAENERGTETPTCLVSKEPRISNTRSSRNRPVASNHCSSIIKHTTGVAKNF